MDGVVPSPSLLERVKKNSPGEARATEPHPSQKTPKTKLSKEIALLQAFVSSSRPSKEELDAWSKIKLAIESTSVTSSVSTTTSARELLEVKQEIKSLSAIVSKLAQKPVPSVTPSLSASRSYSSALQRDLVLPSRRSRELVVSLPAESEEEKKRTGEALVKALQVPSLRSSLEIVAARRLPRVDIAITFSSTSACKQWEVNNPLEQAKIKSRDYNVIIPRFPRGLSSSALDLIECLKASNPKLDIQITKATFLKRGLATQYPRIPLVLSLKEPVHANLVCEKGLVYKGEIYDCELFLRGRQA